jgi:hypothetical protein
MAFSKLKVLLKKVAAPTVTELWEAIATTLAKISGADCRSYLRAAG